MRETNRTLISCANAARMAGVATYVAAHWFKSVPSLRARKLGGRWYAPIDAWETFLYGEIDGTDKTRET